MEEGRAKRETSSKRVPPQTAYVNHVLLIHLLRQHNLVDLGLRQRAPLGTLQQRKSKERKEKETDVSLEGQRELREEAIERQRERQQDMPEESARTRSRRDRRSW